MADQPTSPGGVTQAQSWPHTSISHVLLSSAMFVSMGAALFLGAGRVNWRQGWAHLLAHGSSAVIGALWLLRIDPALSQERSRVASSAKAWDKRITASNLVLSLLLQAVVGVDAGRFHGSRVPVVLRVFALLGYTEYAQRVRYRLMPGVWQSAFGGTD